MSSRNFVTSIQMPCCRWNQELRTHAFLSWPCTIEDAMALPFSPALAQDTELRGEDEGTSTSGRNDRPPMTFDELLATTQVGSGLSHEAITVTTPSLNLQAFSAKLAEMLPVLCH